MKKTVFAIAGAMLLSTVTAMGIRAGLRKLAEEPSADDSREEQSPL